MRAVLKDDATDLANGKATGEREIRALMDDLARAIHAKDVDALMGHYAPDVLTFDLLAPLQYSGADAIRKRVSDSEHRMDLSLHVLSVLFSYSLSCSCARAHCSRNFFFLVLPTRCNETQADTPRT